jgi:hypothetical protein
MTKKYRSLFHSFLFLGLLATASTMVNKLGSYQVSALGTRPSVVISSPISNSVLSGTVDILAVATASAPIKKVDFFVDQVFLASRSAAPYITPWDTTLYANNTSHRILARAYDTQGLIGTSSAVLVSVHDITPPKVVITNPVSATASHSAVLAITANASDVSGIARVRFYVNNVLKCTITASPYICNWQVPASIGTTYTLKAVAADRGIGNLATASAIVVSN